MANLYGKRYVCTVCGAEYLVLDGGDGTMVCCGKPLELKETAACAEPDPSMETEVLLGRRYYCEACKTEVICSKPGKEIPTCCGAKMKYHEPKKISAAF